MCIRLQTSSNKAMETDTQVKLRPNEERVVMEHAKKIVEYRKSIRLFVKEMWGLEPQPVKPQYREAFETVSRATGRNWEVLKKTVKPYWFGDYDEAAGEWKWYAFEKGKHFSWQQNLILMGVEKAVAGDAPRHISVVSGHGIGKSATCAWFTLWFLYCYFGSQVPVTAPTSSQMHDVLWKELSIWISRMPVEAKELYEWQHDYVRMQYSPESWFARARTSTKENTEAIAGVHADHVAIVIDEASGVPEQVFVTAQGALTSGNVFVFMISNGTRTIGYFFDSHHKDALDNQLFSFSSEESPLVDKSFVQRMAKKYKTDSEEYKIRVKGGFPGEDMVDDTGYLQLIPEQRITVRLKSEFDVPFIGRKILGVDPAGEGKDTCTFVVRDRFKAEVVAELRTSNDRQIAEYVLTLMDRFDVRPEDVVVAAFGIGSDVGKEIALATSGKKGGAYEIYTVLEGTAPKDEEAYNGHFFTRHDDEKEDPASPADSADDLYLNLRALMYFRARNWLYAGGAIVDESVDNSEFKQELVVIRYKRTLHGNRIQLMSKKEMAKLRIPSPNKADAFALTFLRDLDEKIQTEDERATAAEEYNVDDPFSAL